MLTLNTFGMAPTKSFLCAISKKLAELRKIRLLESPLIHGLTVAVTLSQSDMKAWNPVPSTEPAVLQWTLVGSIKIAQKTAYYFFKPQKYSNRLLCNKQLKKKVAKVTLISTSMKCYFLQTHCIDSRIVFLRSAALSRICSSVMSLFSLSTTALALISASMRFMSFLCRKSASCSMVSVQYKGILIKLVVCQLNNAKIYEKKMTICL